MLALYLLTSLLMAVALAHDVPAIAARQLSKQDLLSRATRTRSDPARRAPSSSPCNTFNLQSENGQYVYLDPEDAFFGLGEIDNAAIFVSTGSNVELQGSSPDVIRAKTDAASFVVVYDNSATPLTCSFVNSELRCNALTGNNPTAAFFSTCTFLSNILRFSTSYFDDTCTTHVLSAVPACT